MSAATDDLLRLIDNRMMEKVLVSAGNGQRPGKLLALLKKPLTASDLVYEEKGVYVVKPHRVQGIVVLLAGVRDLIETQYTSGEW